LLNYGANAIKFTDSGSVTLGVERIEETADNMLIRFSVKDAGIGIDQEVFPRLFSDFQQGENTGHHTH